MTPHGTVFVVPSIRLANLQMPWFEQSFGQLFRVSLHNPETQRATRPHELELKHFEFMTAVIAGRYASSIGAPKFNPLVAVSSFRERCVVGEFEDIGMQGLLLAPISPTKAELMQGPQVFVVVPQASLFNAPQVGA